MSEQFWIISFLPKCLHRKLLSIVQILFFFIKYDPLPYLWLYGYPWILENLNLHNLRLHSPKVSVFLGKWFLKKILKIFSCIFLCINSTPTPLCPHSNSGDHVLNKPKFTLPDDAYIQVSAVLTNWFMKKFKSIFLNSFLCERSIPIVDQPYPYES